VVFRGKLEGQMPKFVSYDGTEISYRDFGRGKPLVCIPGGPGRAAVYLGDLAGLDETRRLIQLDLRGVGESASGQDPAAQEVGNLVEDVEALRRHLGLDQFDLLAHSAGSVLAVLYAASHPDRLSSLLLITPGLGAVGIAVTEQDLAAKLERHAAEPWYPHARAGLERIAAGDLSLEAFAASRPVFYSRWDAEAQAHATLGTDPRYQPARERYFANYEVDPMTVRVDLKAVKSPVLLYGGGLDPMVTPAMLDEAKLVFSDVQVAVDLDASHFPWVDRPATFAARLTEFLS